MFIVPMSCTSSQLARSFDRLASRPGAADAAGAERSPSLDVAETEREYGVTLDLPGVTKEDVKISIDGRRVNVKAQSRREESKKEGERVIYRERALASYARTFTLPEEIEQAESQAKLDNGVLTLTLAKKRATPASHLTIN